MRPLLLVVEDNADNRKLIEWILEDAGFDFVSAATGEEALRLADRHPIELVLMDVSLPGMDGKEATRRLRAQPRFACLPILAVTAHAVKGEEEAIRAAGVDDIVTKPVDETVLLDAIRSRLPPEDARRRDPTGGPVET